MSDTARVQPLNSTSHPNKRQVGQTAYKLWELSKQNLPIPDLYLLDREFVQEILLYNNFDSKIKQLFDLTRPNSLDVYRDMSAQIKSWVKQAQIPNNLARELILFYHQHFKNTQVAISLSPISSQIPDQPIQIARGDANFVLTILKVIADSFSPSFLKLIEQNGFQDISPGAIMLFNYGKPESSGIAFSRHPQSGDKHQIVINLGPETAHQSYNFSQTHQYDIYDQSIKSQFVGNNKQTVNKKALTDLAQMVLAIKKKQLEHVILEWIMDHNQPKIINIHPDNSYSQIDNSGLVKVKTLVGGNSFGNLTLYNQKTTSPIKNQLLVIDHLAYPSLPLIESASGLILKKLPSQLILDILRKKRIPTVLADQLPQYLYQQQVQLNADQSWLRLYEQTAPIQANQTNKLIFAHFNHQTEHYYDSLSKVDGLLVDSNIIYQRLKIHPQRLVEKKQTQLFEKSALGLLEQIENKLHKPILFKSISFDEKTLTSFKDGKKYKLDDHKTEKGSQIFIRFPQVLEMELRLVSLLGQKLMVPIYYVINNINSLTDWQFINFQIENFNKSVSQPIRVLIEIDNPALLIQIDQLDNYQGLIINVNKITRHLLGLTMDEEIEIMDQTATIRLIASAVKKLTNNTQVLLMLDRHERDLIEQLEKDFSGLIVPPKLIDIVKNNY